MPTRFEVVDAAEWQLAVDRCPFATFFHTPGWYRLAAMAAGGVPEALGVRLADGGLVVVPRLLVAVRRGWIRQAVCGAEGGYGGVLAPRPLAAEEFGEVIRALYTVHQDLVLVGNPHAGEGGLPEGSLSEVDCTRVIPVREPFAQEAAFSPSRRRHLRRAREAGLRVTFEVAPPPKAADEIYPVYAAHAARWTYRRWVRDAAWFRALFREGGDALVLGIVWEGARPVGFQIVALGAAAALQLHLATDPARQALNPGTLLIAEGLADLHRRGQAAFDCLPSGRLSDVAAFKASLGAQPASFYRLHRQGLLQRVFAGLGAWRSRLGLGAALAR